MSGPITVPTAPPLATVPNVEILQTGTWDLLYGTATFTTDDLRSAVAALGCPAVRRPVLKLGHDSPLPIGDGEPAVGYIDNMAVADAGRTLVGDYAGMPGWLGDVIASAYPDRSMEGEWDYRCQMGHTHPFVVHAVALLGVQAPGVGTLASLQDVAELYGVAASRTEPPTGTPVAVHVKGSAMPNPTPRLVAASVTSEDVIRAFYSSPAGSSWDAWVEELQLEPLQIIYIDDAQGERYRVPITIGTGDGQDAVTFGDPVRVAIRYDDVPATAAATAGDVGQRIRFATRAESRRLASASEPTDPAGPTDPADPEPGAPEPTPDPTPSQEGSAAVAFTEDQISEMRQRLGVADDADEATILAALNEALEERADEPEATPAQLPEGVTTIDAHELEELRVAARRGDEARAQQETERRESLVNAAVQDGRIPPARREHWLTQLATDPGAESVLAGLAPGLVPVGAEIGNSASSADDALYAQLFGKDA